MGGGDDDVWFQLRNGSIMNCPSSGMSTNPLTRKVSGMTLNSVSMYKSPSGADHFFGSGWDSITSLSHIKNFGVSSMVSHSEFVTSPNSVATENQGFNSASNLVQYLSHPSFVELVPKIPCFGSGNFSEMVSSFGLPENSQIANSGCPSNKDGGNEQASINVSQSFEDLQISEEATIGVSSNGKTGKRAPESTSLFNPKKNAEVELPKDSSGDSCVLKEEDGKKQKGKQNTGANLRGKQAAKQAKDSSHSGEAQREYSHVRAKTGQATNSHSLAERVRREKISERMRLLQELVPGCNKITGKAVMLDEIINYVQSLQQQVEKIRNLLTTNSVAKSLAFSLFLEHAIGLLNFLSMKLATVNPELNVDIERILSKDILHSRSGGAALLGFSSGMNCSQPNQPGIFPGTMPSILSANPQFPPLPPSVLDHEFQSLYPMGFDSGSAIDSLVQNAGRLKSEL